MCVGMGGQEGLCVGWARPLCVNKISEFPLTLLGTDSCRCSESSASVFGVVTNSLFGPKIQRVFV